MNKDTENSTQSANKIFLLSAYPGKVRELRKLLAEKLPKRNAASNAWNVFSAIYARCDANKETFISRERLQQESWITKPTAYRQAISDLEELGIISVTSRKRSDGGQSTNLYRIAHPGFFTQHFETPVISISTSDGEGVLEVPGGEGTSSTRGGGTSSTPKVFKEEEVFKEVTKSRESDSRGVIARDTQPSSGKYFHHPVYGWKCINEDAAISYYEDFYTFLTSDRKVSKLVRQFSAEADGGMEAFTQSLMDFGYFAEKRMNYRAIRKWDRVMETHLRQHNAGRTFSLTEDVEETSSAVAELLDFTYSTWNNKLTDVPMETLRKSWDEQETKVLSALIRRGFVSEAEARVLIVANPLCQYPIQWWKDYLDGDTVQFRLFADHFRDLKGDVKRTVDRIREEGLQSGPIFKKGQAIYRAAKDAGVDLASFIKNA